MCLGLGEVGTGLYCYKIQCRLTSNGTKTPPPSVAIREEKERERTGIELNEQKGSMTITHLAVRERVHNVCVVVVGWLGVVVGLARGFSVSVLSGRVRGNCTGRRLSHFLSLSFFHLRPRG